MGKQVSRDEQAKRSEHIKQWQESGLSKTAYCALHGMSRSSFSHWIMCLNKASAVPAKATVTLVPVVKKSSDIVSTSAAISGVQLHHKSGWHVILPGDVSADWLSQFLRQLA